MDKQGKGDFAIEINNGILTLRQYTIAEMDKVKAEGTRQNFILNANYTIEDGVLYISGDKRYTKNVYSFFNHDYHDFKGSEKEVAEMLDTIYVSKERIYTYIVKKWFTKNRIEQRIKQDYYLKKKGIITSYQTSNFLIIE